MRRVCKLIFKIFTSKLALTFLIFVLLIIKANVYFTNIFSKNYYKCFEDVKISEYLSDFYGSVKDALEPIEFLWKLRNGTITEDDKKGYKEISSFLYHYYCPYRYYSDNITKHDGWNKNPPFYIFSSYYDDRDSDFFLGRPVLQIISSAYNSTYVNDKDYYCHFFDSTTKNYLYSSPVMVRTLWNRAWDPRLSFYTSFLLTCPIKKNNMNVVFNVAGPYCPNKDLPLNSFVIPQQSKGDDIKITTCVKGLDFDEDLSIKLIEWIEWQRHFGINHITFYQYKVHSNMDKVLKYYVDSGYVTVIPITLPGYQPNDPKERSLFIRRNKQQKRRNELIPYNDCFYRHLKDSQYILVIDIDEIAVTMNDMKYQEMIKLIPDYKYSSIMVQNVFKFKDDSQILDKYLPLGSHKYRCKDSQGKEAYAKPFISTKYASSVFTHFAFHKQVNGTKKFYLPKEIGIKLHFKDTCPSESMYECDKLINSTIDDDLLISRSKNVRENVIKVGLSLKLIN